MRLARFTMAAKVLRAATTDGLTSWEETGEQCSVHIQQIAASPQMLAEGIFSKDFRIFAPADADIQSGDRLAVDDGQQMYSVKGIQEHGPAPAAVTHTELLCEKFT